MTGYCRRTSRPELTREHRAGDGQLNGSELPDPPSPDGISAAPRGCLGSSWRVWHPVSAASDDVIALLAPRRVTPVPIFEHDDPDRGDLRPCVRKDQRRRLNLLQ